MASQNQPERRVHRRSSQPDSPAVDLICPDLNGQSQRLPAEILDISRTGIKIQLRTALVCGVIYGLESSVDLPARQARVAWCRSSFSSLFHAGLTFVEMAIPAPEPAPVAGEEDLFKRLTGAFQTLSEPDSRAACDLLREQSHLTRTPLFTSMETTLSKESERRKRAGVLNVLYARRVQDPVNHTLTIFDFEELLGVPRDQLEFTLWYLKERAYISRTDNNRFQITISGVDYAESLDAQIQAAEPLRSDRVLPAA